MSGVKIPNYGRVLAKIDSNPYSYGVKTFHHQPITRTNTTSHDIAHGSRSIMATIQTDRIVAQGVQPVFGRTRVSFVDEMGGVDHHVPVLARLDLL